MFGFAKYSGFVDAKDEGPVISMGTNKSNAGGKKIKHRSTQKYLIKRSTVIGEMRNYAQHFLNGTWRKNMHKSMEAKISIIYFNVGTETEGLDGWCS